MWPDEPRKVRCQKFYVKTNKIFSLLKKKNCDFDIIDKRDSSHGKFYNEFYIELHRVESNSNVMLNHKY